MLEKHFDDHGDEFDAADEADYEAKASSFMSRDLGDVTLECVRKSDGARIRYNYQTQEFGIVSSGGAILTYFRPDPRYHGMSTNRAYFEWECKKRA